MTPRFRRRLNSHTLSKKTRDGVALIVALVALAVFAGLCHTLAGIALRRHIELDRDLEQAQVRWLAESGVLRALARLKSDPAWAGETWQPQCSNTAMDSSRKWLVTIECSRTETLPSEYTIQIHARSDAGADGLRQVVRTVRIPAATVPSSEPPS
jgi:hypothetical protein